MNPVKEIYLWGVNKIYPYQLVADYFIALSNETQSLITNLKLQKLVYYAQAWNLALLKRELISDDFQAWVHGPVLPNLYNNYRQFSWKPIIREDLQEGILAEIKKQFEPDVLKVLADVEYEYFGLEPYQLEKLTHNEDPWVFTRDGLANDEPSHRIISKQLIRDYYSKYIVNE